MKPGKRAQLVLPAILFFLSQSTFAQDISTVVSSTQLPAPYTMATIPFTGIAPAVPIAPRTALPGTRSIPTRKQPVSKPGSTAAAAVTQVGRVRAVVRTPKKASSSVRSINRFDKVGKLNRVPETETKPLPFVDPSTNISTEVITKAQSVPNNPEAKTVALTFDDGPSPVYTRQVLAILKENQIHATFCVVGRQVKLCPDLVRQIVAEGHKIANHSMNHDESLAKKAGKKIKTEVLAENELILSCAPEAKIEYFRAPAGNWNMKLRKLSASWGMKALGWSIDTKDWQHPGADAIVNHVTKYIHSRGVVLMHDGGGDRSESVAALKRIIPLLKASGYEFTFPE